MASLIKHKSGIYQIVYYKNGIRIWRSLGTRDRNLAHTKFMEYEKTGPPQKTSPRGLPSPIELSAVGITVHRATDEFTTYVKVNLSQKTQKDYKSITKLVTKFFGPEKPIMEITGRDIEMYKNAKCSKKVSPHTVNHNLRCIKSFFNRLLFWEYIEKNPCLGVKLLRIDETIRPYLSREDLKVILLHTIGTQIHTIILFAVLTGLRLSEIVNLTWGDIILEKRKIIVRSSGTFRTKSGKIRILPINSDLHKLLADMQDKSGLLFKGKDGGQLRTDFVSKQFKKAVIRCKLNPKLHFHSLRHTFGSYLVEQGVSLFHVQQLMGHSSPFVTQIYAHLGNAELMSSVEKISVVV